jgi:hypothetical protein
VGMKRNTIDMGNYRCTNKEFEAFRWCIHNNIYISPKAMSTAKWSIIIEMNKKINVSPDVYGKIEIWKQIYKYYIYYYEKYEK